MLFAPIVPILMLEEIRNEAYHMVLAPMCRISLEYLEFYKSVDGYKILDNGAAEHVNIDEEELLQIAFNVRADEVIAPDAYGRMDESYHKLRQFMPTAQSHNVMAVLQSDSWASFDYIFKAALNLEVAAVGLPRVMRLSMGPMARLAAAELIRSESEIPIHALGCTPRLSEARDLARQGIVRGIDSSAPVALGLQGRGLRAHYFERQPDFFLRKPNQMARVNLDTFRKWCAETPPESTL